MLGQGSSRAWDRKVPVTVSVEPGPKVSVLLGNCRSVSVQASVMSKRSVTHDVATLRSGLFGALIVTQDPLRLACVPA